MLENGQGKSRANREGDARSVKRFRNLVLSSGEKSLSEVMASVGQMAMAGQEVRIIEIAADAGCGFGALENIHGAKTSQEFAEHLKKAVTENYGHAGRAFVEILANPELQPRLIE
jgi:putative DNA primase/helicase